MPVSQATQRESAPLNPACRFRKLKYELAQQCRRYLAPHAPRGALRAGWRRLQAAHVKPSGVCALAGTCTHIHAILPLPSALARAP